jgi:uncharacterized membrane protein YfcA
MDPAIILFGLGVGVLVGATGMGGGALMTPLLILIFGVKPVVAVGTDLAYAAVTKTVGGWRHLMKGAVHKRMAVWLAVGSCPGALVGVWVLDRLRDAYGDGFDDLLMVLISAALLLTGLLILLRALALSEASRREREHLKMATRHKVAAIVLGFTIGIVLGVTSAGSGTLIAVGLIMGFRLTPHLVVGTDVVHAAVLLWVASAAHLISGNVDLALAGTILLGSIPGVWIGANLSTKLPADALRPALAIVLVASGITLLTKAGLEIPVTVLVAVPLGLAVLSYLVHRSRHSIPRPPMEVSSR